MRSLPSSSMRVPSSRWGAVGANRLRASCTTCDHKSFLDDGHQRPRSRLLWADVSASGLLDGVQGTRACVSNSGNTNKPDSAVAGSASSAAPAACPKRTSACIPSSLGNIGSTMGMSTYSSGSHHENAEYTEE